MVDEVCGRACVLIQYNTIQHKLYSAEIFCKQIQSCKVLKNYLYVNTIFAKKSRSVYFYSFCNLIIIQTSLEYF